MPRPRTPYLRSELKLSLPAALVAEINLLFEDPLTRRPRYGDRSKLVEALLRNWLATMKGTMTEHVPTIEELQEDAL